MAIQQGYGGQQRPTLLFNRSGTITTGGTSQLALEVSLSRTYLFVENLDATQYLYVEIGSARATAALTSGAVSSCSITNGGFGFTYPPLIEFIGGGATSLAPNLGVAQPGYPAPGYSEGGNLPTIIGSRPAQAHAVLTGGVVTSIVLDDPGSGYVAAPLVFMTNDPRDPLGCADPFYGSVASGIQLRPGGSLTWETSVCGTDAVAVYGAGTGQAFTLHYMP